MNLDLAIDLFIQDQLRTPFLDAYNKFITSFGDNGIFWITFCIILIIVKKTRYIGVVCFMALVIDFISVEVLKAIVNRARPYESYQAIKILIEAPAGSSFPSGHASSSFSVAITYFALGKKGINRIIRWFILILASMIAFSRLYLFVHYPSDVITGIIVAAIASYLAIKLCSYLKSSGKLKFLRIT